MKNIKTLLVCPITKQDLLPLSAKKETVFLAHRRKDKLRYIDGQKVTAPVESLRFLCTESQQVIYSVIDDMPVLIETKQISNQFT